MRRKATRFWRPWRWLVILILLLVAVVTVRSLRGAPPVPADRLITLAPSVPGTPLTLAVFGTSLTARSRWPEAVAAGLETCLDRPVSLARVAHSGAMSTWGVDHAAEVVAAAPDIVLLEFAINDADVQDGLSLDASIANHRAMIHTLQTGLPDARVVLLTMSPAQGLRGVLRPFLSRYYASYRPLAVETGAGLIDLYPRWLRLPRGSRGLGDGLHPDDATALPVIVPALLDQLGLMAGKACDPG